MAKMLMASAYALREGLTRGQEVWLPPPTARVVRCAVGPSFLAAPSAGTCVGPPHSHSCRLPARARSG